MSLPIPNIALIHGATRLATHVAGRVGKAMGFDEVLRGADAPHADLAQIDVATQNAGEVQNTAAVRDRLTHQIRSLLEDAGISVNQELHVSVDQQHNLRVDVQHSRSAEIEAVLNQEPALKREFESLARLEKRNDFSIDLTSSGAVANMIAPGGYPNW